MIWLWLTLGAWRSWSGAGIGYKFLTWAQYPALLVLVFLATWNQPWQMTLVDAAFLFLLENTIHGAMLKFPLNAYTDNRNKTDIFLRIVGGPGGGVPRYLAYAGLRYVVPAALWGVALHFAGATPLQSIAPVIGSIWIVACYLYFTKRIASGKTLPTFTRIGDEAANWSELTGWTGLGVVLTIGAALA